MATRNMNTCCCCIPFRVGAIILLWFNVVGGITGLWMTILCGFTEESIASHGFAFYILLFDQIAWLLFSILALQGAYSNEPYSMKPLLALWAIRLVFNCMSIIMVTSGMSAISEYLTYAIKHINERTFRLIQFESELGLATIYGLFTSFLVGVYFFYIIYSYYCELLERYDEEDEEEYQKLVNRRSFPPEYYPPPTYYQSQYQQV